MSRVRHWCITLNNPDVSHESMIEKLQAICNYAVFQLEIGDQGTLHWQMYVELKKASTLGSLKKHIDSRIHAEARKGARDVARHYCMKPVTGCDCEHCVAARALVPNLPDDRDAGPWEIGVWSEASQGKRSDLSEAIVTLRARGIDAVREEHPEAFVRYHKGLNALLQGALTHRDEPPEVAIVLGLPGCGKSYLARQNPDNLKSWDDPLDGDMSWFDGLDNAEKAIFDDFDGRRSGVKLRTVLRLLDRYAIRVPVKGAFTSYAPREVWLTTNYHPNDWYDWADRAPQYEALKRRVTIVYHFRRDQWRQTPTIISWRDTELWDRWWAGPRPCVPGVLGPLDLWVEGEPSDDPYDFIPSQQ